MCVSSLYQKAVKFRYHAVQIVTILHTALRVQWQNVNQILESQQYPAFMGELWDVICEHFGENGLRFNGSALYIRGIFYHKKS